MIPAPRREADRRVDMQMMLQGEAGMDMSLVEPAQGVRWVRLELEDGM